MKKSFFLSQPSFALSVWLVVLVSLSMYSSTRMDTIYSSTRQLTQSVINLLNDAFDIAMSTPAIESITKAPRVKKVVIPTSDLTCMAENIYYEAGNQSYAGKLAVGNVVLNRVAKVGYPRTICGVIYDGANNEKTSTCQFTWTCTPHSEVDKSSVTWRQSLAVAKELLANTNTRVDITEGAAWYHADYVSPAWAKQLKLVTTIDRHLFYRQL